MPLSPQAQSVFTANDAINSGDPNREADGSVKELVYGVRMTEELNNFMPEASELLQIAARAQHIERWILPRSDYPMDRAGYKKWRTELGMHHAKRASELMQANGYSDQDCQTVADMLQKKRLKRDPDVQALEDVICLVFIRYYLEDFAAKHDEPKLISIIQKTWNKMSEAGHEAALKIALPEPMLALITKALSP
ncbi:DUF4202 domain-containing protein [Gilvimarinus sp. SDUM040013]|uniref:DUF4202 domain-containing protein n=1 Tax=Gilvimarinus gilvus TaxID=3058038 RepID=A0ABU4RVL0_9GAMM|nr:DUF4202 domain-containing protein [Gilvimarinus sp. SDUM040013]MDO3388193.1 DUF4202 domain-containing protein [Gilvimarinus sp. SDUM040013]MDX6847743.1 DUF4202 domain-containing protein [Gilvimarinus sp. SDUM040013]